MLKILSKSEENNHFRIYFQNIFVIQVSSHGAHTYENFGYERSVTFHITQYFYLIRFLLKILAFKVEDFWKN